MGEVLLKGDPPFELSIVQAAPARVVDKAVEILLAVSAPELRQWPFQIRARMTHLVASALADQMRVEVSKAESGWPPD
jgi:hypothetical protein